MSDPTSTGIGPTAASRCARRLPPNSRAVSPATTPIPLYYRLKTLLTEEILSGVYRTDGRLPTEQELCKGSA